MTVTLMISAPGCPPSLPQIRQARVAAVARRTTLPRRLSGRHRRPLRQPHRQRQSAHRRNRRAANQAPTSCTAAPTVFMPSRWLEFNAILLLSACCTRRSVRLPAIRRAGLLPPDSRQRLEISYLAQVDRPCPVNLTNHAYLTWTAPAPTPAPSGCSCSPIAIARRRRGLPADLTPVAGSGMIAAENAAAGFPARQRPAAGKRLRSRIPASYLWSAGEPGIFGPPTASANGRSPTRRRATLQRYTGNAGARDGGSYADHAGVALESEFARTARTIPVAAAGLLAAARAAIAAHAYQFYRPAASPCAGGELL
ncbi:hypothetical protein M8494_19915 [Serratia ureilytica]